MTNSSDTKAQSPCPTKQMSFGDAVRYLQGGFDEPVQRAVAAHVQYCNSCQEHLEHVRALRRTGGQLLSSPQETQDLSAEELTDAALAAYLDGALPSDEHDRVTRQIASNYNNYLRFSALKTELNHPLEAGFAPPVAAIENVKVAVPDLVTTEWRTPVEIVLERLTQSVQTLFALRWPAPAMAFAVGAILMMVFSPGAQTIVTIPGLTPPGMSEDSHIRSGLGDDASSALAVDVVIPVKKRQDVTFTWNAASNQPVSLYRVLITDADGTDAIEQIVTENNAVTLKANKLHVEVPYTLSVVGSLENGGMMPVARYTFSLTNDR